MEFQQIRYLLAIYEPGGFSCAAQACDVSQPALTAAINKLEAEIGAPVFYREGKRLLLTELGRMVKPHLEQVLTSTRTAHEIARNFTLLHVAPVRIGVMTTIGPVRVSRIFRRFNQRHPGLKLTVRDAMLPQLLHELERGEIDIAVVDTHATSARWNCTPPFAANARTGSSPWSSPDLASPSCRSTRYA